MTGQVVGRLFSDIQKECHQSAEGAKAVIEVYDERQGDKKYLVWYPPPGQDGTEALDPEHAEHIRTAAAEHADTIGVNFDVSLPDWDPRNMLSKAETNHAERCKQFTYQQEANAVASGHPDLEDLCNAERTFRGLLNNELTCREQNTAIADLAQAVVKQLNSEMQNLLLNHEPSWKLRELERYAEPLGKGGMITLRRSEISGTVPTLFTADGSDAASPLRAADSS